MTDAQSFAERIKAYRSKHKLSQKAFAKGCGYSYQYLQELEQGKAPSETCRDKIEAFMHEATETQLATLRGPGPGNSPKLHRRGRKLRPHELDRRDLYRSEPSDIDDDLLDLYGRR